MKASGIIIAVGAVGALGAVWLMSRGGLGLSLAPLAVGAPGGPLSSQPGTQYPWTATQGARADNNPALNNQPWAQQAPSGGGLLGTVTGIAQTSSAVASAATDVWDAFQSLFGSDSAQDASSTFSLWGSNDGSFQAGSDGYSDDSMFSLWS